MKTRKIHFCAICKKGWEKKNGEWMTFTAYIAPMKKYEKYKMWICNDCKTFDIDKIKGISIGGTFNPDDISLIETSIVKIPGEK